jgi:potassium-transporting ATPase KdpC subunit
VTAPTGAAASRPAPVPAGRSHGLLGHVRAAGLFLVLAVLVSGFLYPLVVTEIAQAIDPVGANGSLLKDPNGTVVGSSLIAQNLSAPYLFWARPSLTDYNMMLGADTPPGSSDPALAALLNETLQYMRQYGNLTVNATLPFWYVAPSASDVDPDLTPEAVLVQVPRVAAHTNLTIGFLTDFVNRHIQNPPLPFIGVPYVNVLELDLDLLPLIGK